MPGDYPRIFIRETSASDFRDKKTFDRVDQRLTRASKLARSLRASSRQLWREQSLQSVKTERKVVDLLTAQIPAGVMCHAFRLFAFRLIYLSAATIASIFLASSALNASRIQRLIRSDGSSLCSGYPEDHI